MWPDVQKLATAMETLEQETGANGGQTISFKVIGNGKYDNLAVTLPSSYIRLSWDEKDVEHVTVVRDGVTLRKEPYDPNKHDQYMNEASGLVSGVFQR